MRAKPTYNGIEFDSNEEIEFYMWIQEAINAGLLYTEFTYQPESFLLSGRQSREEIKQLKTKTKILDKFLLRPHLYTADFSFELTSKGCDHNLPFEMHERGPYVVVDIKGGFNLHGGDRGFAINQKWVYEKYGVFVNKVVPEKLFKATWVPHFARFTPKTNQLKRKFAKCKTIKEFLNN